MHVSNEGISVMKIGAHSELNIVMRESFKKRIFSRSKDVPSSLISSAILDHNTLPNLRMYNYTSRHVHAWIMQISCIFYNLASSRMLWPCRNCP